jgi:CRP-like cAMP-binding protein
MPAYDLDHMSPDLLAALPKGQDRLLTAGEALFRAGDRPIGLALVRHGAVELRRVSAEGRLLILHRAGPGESFAEASLFEPRHHCDAIAIAPSLVTVHAATAMRRAAAADPSIGWRLAAHLAARLVAERARAERLVQPRAADRLLDALHALPVHNDGMRHLGGSWKALAAELGLTHEATYRTLARLEREGLVRREGRGAVRLLARAGC